MNKTRLLLHICCAPDATVVVERLHERFDVVGYFYNPNINDEQEYQLRAQEMARLASSMNFPVIFGAYDADRWLALVKGMEEMPEGGKRCETCFRMRLEAAARYAVTADIKLFATVLTVSPHKNAEIINAIGAMIARQFPIEFLTENFKKKDGFKRSIELSKHYQLYRQNYCGCIYSKRRSSHEQSDVL